MLPSCETIYLLATAPCSTVHAIVTIRAFVTTVAIAIAARKLYVRTIRIPSLPASRTLAVALQPGRCLDKSSCEEQAKGYRKYFHCGAIKTLVLSVL